VPAARDGACGERMRTTELEGAAGPSGLQSVKARPRVPRGPQVQTANAGSSESDFVYSFVLGASSGRRQKGNSRYVAGQTNLGAAGVETRGEKHPRLRPTGVKCSRTVRIIRRGCGMIAASCRPKAGRSCATARVLDPLTCPGARLGTSGPSVWQHFVSNTACRTPASGDQARSSTLSAFFDAIQKFSSAGKKLGPHPKTRWRRSRGLPQTKEKAQRKNRPLTNQPAEAITGQNRPTQGRRCRPAGPSSSSTDDLANGRKTAPSQTPPPPSLTADTRAERAILL